MKTVIYGETQIPFIGIEINDTSFFRAHKMERNKNGNYNYEINIPFTEDEIISKQIIYN